MPNQERLHKPRDPAVVAEKEAKEAEDRAYGKAIKGIRSVWSEIETHRKGPSGWRRASGKINLFRLQTRTLRKALQALWDIQTACEKADEAEGALIKASKAHGSHPDKQSSEALEKAKQREQEAQEAKKKATKALQDNIKEVKKADANANELMNNDFGTGQTLEVGAPEYMREEYDAIRQFLKDTIYVLELKSVPNFTRALSHWEAAFEKQQSIKDVYAQISDFYDEAHGVYNKDTRTQTVDGLKERKKRLEELRDSITKALPNKKAEAANKELQKIFRDMADERKRVEGRK